MKCLSKKVVNYKRERCEAERRKVEEEKLAKMTPEERKAYEADKRKRVEETFKTWALVNDVLGPNKYYK